MTVMNPWLSLLTAENELSLKTLCVGINGLLFQSSVLVIMSTTHGCVSQEHKTAFFSYRCDFSQGRHWQHRVRTEHLKVDDLVLKITVVILQLVNTERTKLVLFGSRNPIYLNMSFCGVLLVYFFCFLLVDTAVTFWASAWKQLIYCFAPLIATATSALQCCVYSQGDQCSHWGCLPADAVGIQRKILFYTGACNWPHFTLLCVPSRGQRQAYGFAV